MNKEREREKKGEELAGSIAVVKMGPPPPMTANPSIPGPRSGGRSSLIGDVPHPAPRIFDLSLSLSRFAANIFTY